MKTVRTKKQLLLKALKIFWGSIKAVIILSILVGVLWCGDPHMFTKTKVVEAIYKYHELYGKYPNDLKEVQEKIRDLPIETNYHYVNHGTYFTMYYGPGLNDTQHSYDSRKKKWEVEIF